MKRGEWMLGVIKKRPIVSFLVAVILLCGSIFSYLVYFFFFDLERVSKNEFVSESISPSGEYTIQIFRNAGSATTNDTIAAILIFQDERKTIYWAEGSEVVVEWED